MGTRPPKNNSGGQGSTPMVASTNGMGPGLLKGPRIFANWCFLVAFLFYAILGQKTNVILFFFALQKFKGDDRMWDISPRTFNWGVDAPCNHAPMSTPVRVFLTKLTSYLTILCANLFYYLLFKFISYLKAKFVNSFRICRPP